LFERHGPLIESDPVIRSQYRGALANHLYRVGRKTEARREVLRMLTHRGSRLRGLESIMRFELRRGARSGR
ncbi:MAG TPA: hypothetical protein VHQ39_08400, partial [Dongiaceae bacterium]|nr:hypothetical protein [Dongiaceae bacterium]